MASDTLSVVSPPLHASNAGAGLWPAGWYMNPAGPGHRYWNGARWTDRCSVPQGATNSFQTPRRRGFAARILRRAA